MAVVGLTSKSVPNVSSPNRNPRVVLEGGWWDPKVTMYCAPVARPRSDSSHAGRLLIHESQEVVSSKRMHAVIDDYHCSIRERKLSRPLRALTVILPIPFCNELID